jgi:hypothetical protein
MRIASLCVPILLASSVSFVACHSSKGRANGDSGGQGGIIVPQTGEGGSTGLVGYGGATGTDAPPNGGATGVDATVGSGGTAGTSTSTVSSSGGAMAIGGVPSGPPVAAEDFVAQWAATVCDAVEPCCQASKYGWDRQGCLAKTASLVSAQVDAASTASVTWDAEAAGKCIAGTRRDYAGCNPPIDMELDAVCRSVLLGHKQTGETCSSSIQCVAPTNGQGSCEAIPADGGTGYQQVCTARPSLYARAKLGDACTQNCEYLGKDHVRCYGSVGTDGDAGATDAAMLANCFRNDGLHCDKTTLRCVALAPSGASCSANAECADGLACVSGKCATPPSTGASCTPVSGCAAGLYCDTRKYICMDGLPDGASCGGTSHCQSGSCLCESPTQDHCVCGPLLRWGAVSDLQCTGTSTLFTSTDGGI